MNQTGRLVEVIEQDKKNAGIYVKTYHVGKLAKGIYQIIFTTYENQVPVRKAKSLMVK